MVVDQVLADGDHDLLTFLGLSFLLLMVIQTGVSALRTWTVLWLGTHFSLNWTGNVFQHLLRLPQAYFLKRHLGDVVSRFGAISAIQHTFTTRFVEVVLDGLMALLTLVVLLLYSPLLTGMTSKTGSSSTANFASRPTRPATESCFRQRSISCKVALRYHSRSVA